VTPVSTDAAFREAAGWLEQVRAGRV
jgi:prephenate dehydratase